MRRLLILLLALIPGWLALRLLAGAEALAPWLLRDAALLAALSVGLAAWGALGMVDTGAAATFAWPSAGRALFGAGAITALAGAALRLLAMPNAGIIWGIGIALLLAGAFWRGAAIRYAAPAFRWERDAGGRFVRRPVDGANAGDLALALRPAALWGGVAAIVLLGGALRVALAWAQPPVCVAQECDAVLALSGGAWGGSLIVGGAGRALLPWAGDALWALRLAGALASTLALAALIPALRRWTTGAGLLLGLALAACTAPFALPAYGPWLELGILLPLVFWGIGAGLAEGGPRPWAVAGVALGLAAVVAPAMAAAWLLWFLLLALLLALARRGRNLGVLALAGLAGASISSARAAQFLLPLQGGWGVQAWTSDLMALAAAWTDAAAPWLGALALAGMGAALRARRRGAALLAGAAAVLLVLLRPGVAPVAPQEMLLPLLPFAALLAALGSDQLLRAAARAWGPARAQAAPLLAPALVAILLLGLPPLRQAAQSPHVATAADDLALAAAGYVATMAGAGDDQVGRILLLPPALLDHPAVRLAAAQGIDAGRVRAYSRFTDIPWRDAGSDALAAPGGIVYLLESTDTPLLDELRRVYPDGRSDLVAAEAGNAGLLAAYTVDGAALFDSEGLAQFVYAGPDWGSADEAALSIGVGPLAFGWGAFPPAPPPFSVEWTGALRVADAGSHTFAVEAPPGALFSLLLNGRLILDTSAGLITHSESLPAGLYNVQMRYRSDGAATGDLAVRWQPPGEESLAPIPRAALHNPALPPIGLLGTYTAGGAWDGAVLARRNDRIVEADASLPRPWGVVWQGQLAAPRAGEYRIGAVSNGTLFLDVAGERIAARVPSGSSMADAVAPPPEGAIYLEQGWHPITIRFAATDEAAAPEFRLYWQPPGQTPAALSAAFLLPFTGDRSAADAPLPALGPPDTRFGSDAFALTVDAALLQPQTNFPPRTLPPLPFEQRSSVAGCGAAIDQLSAPHGLAYDPGRGLLYVADTGNRRVLAYLVDGTELRSPLALPLEGLEEPVDVAVTPQGAVYVLDTAAPRLIRYDAATGESRTIPLGAGYYRPRGIAADAFGTLYIADTGGARVTALADDGSLIAQFGGPATALGRGQPVDVAPAARALWAISAEDGRLWQVDTLGSVGAIYATNTIDGPHLAAIAAETLADGAPAARGDSAGGFFLSDPAGGRVLYMGATGQPLGALAGADAFQRPTGVAAWRAGDTLFLAISDTASCTLSLWQAPAAALPSPT